MHRETARFAGVEWLGSSGSQYINTWLLPSDYLLFDADFQMSNSNWGNVFGSRNSARSDEYQLGLYEEGMVSIAGERTTHLGMFPNTRHRVSRYNLDRVMVDGESRQLAVKAGNYPFQIYMFCINEKGAAAQKATGKIYSLKFYTDDEVLRDFRPAVRLEDDEPGMLDVVNMRFYVNAGTGRFTTGTLTGEYY